MYEVSKKLADAIAGTSRMMRAKLVCGSETIDSGIQSIKLTAQANADTDTIDIGGTVSAFAEISLYHPEHMVTAKEYSIYIGAVLADGNVEYCPMGLFTAQKPKEDDGLVTFTAYDRMVSKLEAPYFTDIGKYPADGKVILAEISKKSGVPIANLSTLPDGTMVNWRTVYNDDNSATMAAPFSGYTYRESLMYLAQMYGAFATVNREGALEFRWYANTDYEVKENRSFDDIVCAEQVYELQKITCTKGTDTLTAGSGTTGISIENDLMTQDVLNAVYQKVGKFTYLPTTVSFLGDMRIDLGDIITIYRRDGTAIKVPVMSITQDYDGGMTTGIGSYGSTEESEDKAKGPTAKAIDRVYSDLFLVKEILSDKASINYLEANYATIIQLNAVEAKIDSIIATDITVAYLEANYAKLGYVNASFATIDLANVKDACIKTAMIDSGAVQTLQIADGSITDAKIVNLTANKISAGTLSVERLEIVGSTSSIVYALNNSGELVSQSVNTIDGEVLTERTITADKLVANSITADEIATNTITANEIASNTITAAELSAGSVTTVNLAAGSVTADKVSVADLNALKATIGGFTIGQSYLANGAELLGTAANSVYVGLDGISCGTNFIAKADGTVKIQGNIYCKDGIYLYHSGDEGTYPGYQKIMYFDTVYSYADTKSLILKTSNGSGISISDSLSVTHGLATDKAYIGDASQAYAVSQNQKYALQAESFLCNSWVRTSGATGWYSETYAGGMYMTDSTAVRVFNSKQLRVDNTIFATSIELSMSTPFIDFHYNKSAADYTSRIIEGTAGALTVIGSLDATNGAYSRGARCTTSSGGNIHNFDNVGNNYLQVSGYSYGTNAGATWGVNWWTSDINLKKNIQEVTKRGLDVICNIHHRQFDWKSRADHVSMGYIAQELACLDKDLVLHVKQPEGAEYAELLQIDETKLIPYITKAIQELNEKLQHLERQLAQEGA